MGRGARQRSGQQEVPMAGEPPFFELGVRDPERGRAFYGALFG
ncbi:hypothetical protein ACLGIH_29780 [Streptomyces sp. HMX87]